MDNALVIDGIIAVVLLAGVIIGWKRGLFKSLMGLLIVVLALVGSVMLADMLTEPITDVVAPKVEDVVVDRFSAALEEATGSGAAAIADGESTLEELFEQYNLPTSMLDSLLGSVSGALSGAAASAREKAADSFRDSVSAKIRSLVSSVVHAALVLVLYVALLIVLKLLTRVLGHVFDLPVLNTVNNLGGAAIGLIEAILLLYVVIYIGSRFGTRLITDYADDSYLLPIFLNHSPVELISSLTQKG